MPEKNDAKPTDKCTAVAYGNTAPYTVHHFLSTGKQEDCGLYEVEEANEHIVDLRDGGREQEALEVAEANASLIQQAFVVFAETGKAPRELAEQAKALREALKGAREIVYGVAVDFIGKMIWKTLTALSPRPSPTPE